MGQEQGSGQDPFLKKCFNDPILMESLVRDFAPPRLVRRLDFATLEARPGSFVTDDVRERISDRVWRIRCRTDGEDCWCYLHVVAEFQSRPDPWMVLRIIQYMILLWLDLAARKEIRPGDRLPPILPIVWYTGEQEWRGPRRLSEMLHPVTAEIWEHLGDFILADVHRVPASLLRNMRDPLAHLIALERSGGLLAAVDAIRAAIVALPGPEFAGPRRILMLWLLFGPGLRRGLVARLPHLANLREDDPMLEERFLQSFDDYDRARRAEGIEVGIGIGREEGIGIGREEGIGIGREEGIGIGREEGIGIGEARGERKRALETARTMLADGADHALIARYSGLSLEEVAILAAGGLQ